MSEHVAMLHLLLELCNIPVETLETTVGRPLKWTQSGCLLPHCRSKSFGGWYNYFQVDSRGSSGLQAHHDVGFYCTHCVPAYEFRKAVGCLDGQTTGGGSIPRWSAGKPQVW